MTTKPLNPLSKHFRQPAIYMQLPSRGRFWPTDSLELPVTGEIPVYPMTARDEITIRTPDALLNGQGVVDVIQSCCPSITNAWKMPSIDVDAVLLSIRIASYGNTMDFDAKCPACQEESRFGVDVGNLVSQISMPDYDSPVNINGLQIRLRPQPYFEANRVSQMSFTEQQILRTVNDTNLTDEQRQLRTNEYLSKLVDLNVAVCVNSTQSITMEDGTIVDDPEYITEFYNMADYKFMRRVQDQLREINAQSEIKPMDAVCDGCKQPFKIPLDFDYANFFA